jgi:hypothetical protein
MMGAILFSVAIVHVRGAGNPSVIVNKYFNSGGASGAGDVAELLVIQNNLDMRGMIIKDFSASMANDGGGKFTFSNDALWSSVRSGTLIVCGLTTAQRIRRSAVRITIWTSAWRIPPTSPPVAEPSILRRSKW